MMVRWEVGRRSGQGMRLVGSLGTRPFARPGRRKGLGMCLYSVCPHGMQLHMGNN